ncbi:MAG: SDR family oxidoreductase [Phycisphaerae bacterium]|nr:SDR family oxidoreductase [Phycisphaerae bacterium]
MSLDGCVALVTGSARRVGRAIALELASAGCDLALHYNRSQDEAAQLLRQIEACNRRAHLIPGDLSQPTSWGRIVSVCVEAFGRLDVLVNNAAVFDPMALAGFDHAAWERTMRINLTAVAGMCHHAAEHLRSGGCGCILNLCDIAADRPFGRHLAYSCAKAGVVALTKALALELAPEVRVNAVSPGIAAFPDDYDNTTRRRLIAKVPLQRAGTPEDIAKAVRYLVADAPYVTGQIIRVDGGRSIVGG